LEKQKGAAISRRPKKCVLDTHETRLGYHKKNRAMISHRPKTSIGHACQAIKG
jgi:hypothetical protein